MIYELVYPLIYYVSLNYYGFCISQYNKCVLCMCVCVNVHVIKREVW